MSMRARIAVPVVAALIVACGGTQTASPAPSPTQPITVSDAWARAGLAAAGSMGAPGMSGAPAMPGASGNSGVFMTIRNTGSADRLVKAMSDVASATEVHSTTMANGVMEMRPVEAVEIPAAGVATLQPGGFHVMLIGLKRDLKVGDSVKITLVFEKAGPLVIDATVRAG